MGTSNSPVRLVRFGAYEADLASFQLLKHGLRIRIQAQPFQILALLLARPGLLVTREEFRTALWPNDTFVDFDKGLNTGVARLRQILSDVAGNPRFIETVPRQGYRFICPVTYVEAPAGTSDPPAASAHEPPHAAAPRNWSGKPLFWIGAAAILIAALYLARQQPWMREPLAGPVSISRVTGTGDVRAAGISPDGKYIAYVRETSGRQSLWLKQTNIAGDVQIVDFGEDDCSQPEFSPDRSCIFYTRRHLHDSDGTLYRVPVLGGTPEPVVRGVSGSPAISPDGRSVAFVRSTRSAHGEDAVIIASTTGADERELARYPAPGIHKNRIAWTSNGTRVVFSAMGTLTGISVADGRRRPAPDQNWDEVEHVAPSPYSTSEVLIAGHRHGDSSPDQIFRVSLDTNYTRQLTHGFTRYRSVRATADGDALLVLQEEQPWTVQIVDAVGNGSGRAIVAERQNLGGERGISWTPDGELLFSSVPFGDERGDLWLMNADGSNRHRITHSPDYIYYADALMAPSGGFVTATGWLPGNRASIWRIDLPGGARKRLTEGTQDFPHAISPDGKWVVYKSVQADGPVLMKVPAEGGKPIRLTPFACDSPAISPEGMWVACIADSGKSQSPELGIVPFAGGPAAKSIPLPSTAKTDVRPVWTPDSRAVSFVNRANGAANIWNQPVNGGAAYPVTRFQSQDIFGFDWSRDLRLVVSQGEVTADAILIRGAERP